MDAAEIVLVAAVMLCAIGFAALTVVLLRVFDALRALRAEVETMRAHTLPLIDDLRASASEARLVVDGARADLDRFDRVLGSAEAISDAVEQSGRAARRLFAAPVIKAVGTATGVRRAASRLRRPGRGVEIVRSAGDERRRA
jgi:hypothetical protein